MKNEITNSSISFTINVVEKPEIYDKYVNKMGSFGKYLKIPLDALFKYSGFFILIYLIGWSLNAIYPNIFRFDLTALRDFFIMVVGKQLGQHGIDSIWNSSKGEPPAPYNQIQQKIPLGQEGNTTNPNRGK